jgi:hypothetical protein
MVVATTISWSLAKKGVGVGLTSLFVGWLLAIYLSIGVLSWFEIRVTSTSTATGEAGANFEVTA